MKRITKKKFLCIKEKHLIIKSGKLRMLLNCTKNVRKVFFSFNFKVKKRRRSALIIAVSTLIHMVSTRRIWRSATSIPPAIISTSVIIIISRA